MSNGYGNVHVGRYDDMDAYDRYPPRLRWLLRNAVSPFSAPHMLARYWTERHNGGGHDQALSECARRVRILDGMQTLQAYGPTHPEARA